MNVLVSLFNSLPGAAGQGLIWGIMAIGVYITYKILDVADLTVDGSLATGGAVAALCVSMGWNPWLAVLAACCLPCAWAGAFVRLAGVGAGAVHRLAALACAGPVYSAAGQLPQQAHTAHAATAGPGSGEGLPIVPPRPGSAIAGRPAENSHGPPPRVFTAPGLVSW